MKRPLKDEIFRYYGVDPSQSIRTVGKVSNRTIAIINQNTAKYRPEAWPAKLGPKDIRLAKAHDFDPHACVTQTGTNPRDQEWDERFVRFACYNAESSKVIRQHLRTLESFAWVKTWHVDLLAFETWFAHIHKDDLYTKTQINIILDNPLGHSIYSVGKYRKSELLTPEKGDIVLLDITRPHAVFPNQDEGIAAMKASPLKALALTIRYDPM